MGQAESGTNSNPSDIGFDAHSPADTGQILPDASRPTDSGPATDSTRAEDAVDLSVSSFKITATPAVLWRGFDYEPFQISVQGEQGEPFPGVEIHLDFEPEGLLDAPESCTPQQCLVSTLKAGKVIVTASVQNLSATVTLEIREWTHQAAGIGFTLALSNDGHAYAWGDNRKGQLGIGSTADYATKPTKIGTSSNLKFSSITAGSEHACAITPSGLAYCWGDGEKGKLGYGSTSSTREPEKVETISNVSVISAGTVFSCAIAQNKTYCWGDNDYGQLGSPRSDTRPQSKPFKVPTEITFVKLSVGGASVFGQSTDGAWYGWGNNVNGKLGLGTNLVSAEVSEPHKTFTSSHLMNKSVYEIVAGATHACARLGASAAGEHANAETYCWGNNSDDKLGLSYTGIAGHRNLPEVLQEKYAHIFLGATTTCATQYQEAGDPKSYCWGNNTLGQLGLGEDHTGDKQSEPAQISGGHTWKTLALGSFHQCGIDQMGRLFCWGDNKHGILGVQSLDAELRAPRLIPRDQLPSQ